MGSSPSCTGTTTHAVFSCNEQVSVASLFTVVFVAFDIAGLQVSNVRAFAAVGIGDRCDVANHSLTRGERQPLAEPAFGCCVVAFTCWLEDIAFLTRHRAGFVVVRFVTCFNRVGIFNWRDEGAAFFCTHSSLLRYKSTITKLSSEAPSEITRRGLTYRRQQLTNTHDFVEAMPIATKASRVLSSLLEPL